MKLSDALTDAAVGDHFIVTWYDWPDRAMRGMVFIKAKNNKWNVVSKDSGRIVETSYTIQGLVDDYANDRWVIM